MTVETNPNTLDSEAIKYLGEKNKKVVMKVNDGSDELIVFEMSVVNNDSNTEIETNIQIGNNNFNK